MGDPRSRILIVDDDPDVLRATERVLKVRYDVRSTSVSTEAPGIAAEFRPDVAICDIQMPDLDGFELLDRLRGSRPDLDVILMTGSLTDQDRHLIRALKQRAYYFILKPFERDVLLTLLERCLETRRLRAAERDHLERIELDLNAARAFQQAMLPADRACVCGVRIDSRCSTYGAVGGDFFDFTESEDRLTFILADARGHGVPAALLTGTVKSVFRSGVASGETPEQIMTNMAQALGWFAADRFVTAFCGQLDPDTGRLVYVNAGHPAALIVHATDEPLALTSNSPLVSRAFPPDSWVENEAALRPGARLFLYTDGLFDSARGKVEFPRERMVAPLREPGAGAEALETLLSAVAEVRGPEPPVDDVTAMLLELPAVPARAS